MDGDAALAWADSLGRWAIPQEILSAAESSPWSFPVAVFAAPDAVAETPSRSRALEALGPSGAVLDVGCGGGAASLALVPPAALVVGVDSSRELLEEFARATARRGVRSLAVEGSWPDCAPGTLVADVVVCHHVVYNVPRVAPFLVALTAHARRRVVLELSAHHPLSGLNSAWEHFWGLSRPTGPTADDLLGVLAELGLSVGVDRWTRPAREATLQERAALARVRLCLPASREPEVREYLAAHPPAPSDVVTVWWEGDSTGVPTRS